MRVISICDLWCYRVVDIIRLNTNSQPDLKATQTLQSCNVCMSKLYANKIIQTHYRLWIWCNKKRIDCQIPIKLNKYCIATMGRASAHTRLKACNDKDNVYGYFISPILISISSHNWYLWHEECCCCISSELISIRAACGGSQWSGRAFFFPRDGLLVDLFKLICEATWRRERNSWRD